MKRPRARTQAPTIAQFIAQGSSAVTAAQIEGFGRLVPKLQAKLRRLQREGHHQLHDEAAALLAYAEPASRGNAIPFNPRAMFEAVFALTYLLKGFDAIPDEVPEIGLADDRILIHHVFKSHPALFTPPAS